jgi:hypothetical protein
MAAIRAPTDDDGPHQGNSAKQGGVGLCGMVPSLCVGDLRASAAVIR